MYLTLDEYLGNYNRKTDYMSEPLSNIKEDNALFAQVKNVLDEARRQVARSVNTTIVKAYWQVGKYIEEYEQQGKGRTEYGKTAPRTLQPREIIHDPFILEFLGIRQGEHFP